MTDRVALSADLPEITSELFTSATGIIGLRGSGKTSDGVVIVEQAVAATVPVAVIDPTGVWWGAKSSADGKSPGLAIFVFGGEHGDVPLEPTAGALLARFIVDNPVPIILDLSDFTKGQQRRFVTEFLVTLFNLKNRQRSPLLLVIDEAPRFVPQGMMRGDIELAKCVGAVEDAVTLGRSRGLGIVLIGQRAATINKNVLTQVDNLIAMRLTGPADRKAIDEWISEKADGHQTERNELVQNLPALKTGEGYFWSPSLFEVFRRVKFAQRTTFDSSRTPKIGEKIVLPTAFAAVDLQALSADIAATIEQAKADDPKALRARIAELEKKIVRVDDSLGFKGTAIVADHQVCDEQLRAMERHAIAAEEDWQHAIAAEEDWQHAIAQRDKLVEVIRDVVQATRACTGVVMSSIEQLTSDVHRISDNLETTPPLERREAPERETVASVSPTPIRPAGGSDEPGKTLQPIGALQPAPLRMLEALAKMGGSANRSRIAGLSGFAVTGGAFRTHLSTLRTRGLIDVSGENVTITAAGKKITGDLAPATTAETLALWRPQLQPAPLRLFDTLVRAYPKSMTRAELADASGFELAGGAFRTHLSTLRVLQIIDVRGQDVSASESLFPTGKPR